ncbi:hypothetical protein K440DRAFT_620470 [Wilcoxina mikolae CBS 423.85]|nr:hypothetical protein K440DRAFT_620470 [Wilcoxina mikolae CBS 423.85]
MFFGGGGGPGLGGRFNDMRDDFGPPPTFGMPPRRVDGHFEPGFTERKGHFENNRGDFERPPAMGHPPHMGHMGPPDMGQRASIPPGVQRRNTTGGRPGNSVRYRRGRRHGDRSYGVNDEW